MVDHDLGERREGRAEERGELGGVEIEGRREGAEAAAEDFGGGDRVGHVE